MISRGQRQPRKQQRHRQPVKADATRFARHNLVVLLITPSVTSTATSAANGDSW